VAAPTVADDVTFDGAGTNGNTAAIISATISCLSFTVTSGYTNTITHNAVLTIAGNITLNTSYTIAGSSAITISASSTIVTGGKVWPNSVTLSNTTGLTYTINTNTFNILGTLTIGTGAVTTFAGTAGFTVATLSCANTTATTINFKESITYTITASFSCSASRVGSIVLFTSSHASTRANLVMPNNGSNTCNVLASFTRIDASGGRTINTFNGTLVDVVNIREFHDFQPVAV
jgi:hypothetical protein